MWETQGEEGDGGVSCNIHYICEDLPTDGAKNNTI